MLVLFVFFVVRFQARRGATHRALAGFQGRSSGFRSIGFPRRPIFFNVANVSYVKNQDVTLGSSFGQPLDVLQPRLLRLAVQMEFQERIRNARPGTFARSARSDVAARPRLCGLRVSLATATDGDPADSNSDHDDYH
jgi:hypothetical protein